MKQGVKRSERAHQKRIAHGKKLLKAAGVLLSLLLAFSLYACGSNNAKGPGSQESSSQGSAESDIKAESDINPKPNEDENSYKYDCLAFNLPSGWTDKSDGLYLKGDQQTGCGMRIDYTDTFFSYRSLSDFYSHMESSYKDSFIVDKKEDVKVGKRSWRKYPMEHLPGLPDDWKGDYYFYAGESYVVSVFAAGAPDKASDVKEAEDIVLKTMYIGNPIDDYVSVEAGKVFTSGCMDFKLGDGWRTISGFADDPQFLYREVNGRIERVNIYVTIEPTSKSPEELMYDFSEQCKKDIGDCDKQEDVTLSGVTWRKHTFGKGNYHGYSDRIGCAYSSVVLTDLSRKTGDIDIIEIEISTSGTEKDLAALESEIFGGITINK